MASRVQQDTFMDDSDEACPLCVEEFDLSDKNFRPCPCGYQVCQFCYNNIKNNMNGLCPACRRPYDEKNIEWKIVSPEEFKADVALQARKKAAARQKEAERRQVETLNRKHLAGLRVVQKNLVYIVGLNPGTREEDLLKTLRGDQYFGQYGKIIKIVVSKGKEGTNGNHSMGVYVTFARKEDAAKCIAAVDGSQNGDRVLKAQHGTTKYCSAYLRNEVCNNRSCMFLHETGEDNDSFSRQDLSSMNAVSTQRPAQPSANSSSMTKSNYQAPPQQPPTPLQQALQNTSAAPQAMALQESKDETMSRSDSGDGSALPVSASWATKNAQTQQSPRSGHLATQPSPSPKTSNAELAAQLLEDQRTSALTTDTTEPSTTSRSSPVPESFIQPARIVDDAPRPSILGLERAVKTVLDSNYKWSLDRSLYDEDTLDLVDNFPALFDINGGAVRYALKKKRDEERSNREEEERNILQAISAAEEDDNPASGSFQLGGEPETQEPQTDVLGRAINSQNSHLQQRAFSNSSGARSFGRQSIMANDFSNLSFNARSLAAQQQQHLLLLKTNTQPENTIDQFQKPPSNNTSLHQPQLSNPFQMQNQHLGNLQGHARQASRYNFANDSSSASTAVKPNTNAHIMAQQSAMMPPNQGKQFTSQAQQQPGLHTNFYSGVQGPPPGLKSSGTPPISGGGMFGQGHGFASAMGGSIGFGGGNVGAKNSNEDLMHSLLRVRNGAGNGLGPEAGKREFMFPSFLQQPTTSTSTPASAPGLLSPLYGTQLAAYNGYQDQGPLKQKKKGKKHRHANTSSSGGGGIVDLADPSILQARMHHGAGQGPYSGTQGQETQISFDISDTISSPIGPPISRSVSKLQSTGRIATLVLPPPGLSVPQDFPPLTTPPKIQTTIDMQNKTSIPRGIAAVPITPITPAVPIQPLNATTPAQIVKTVQPFSVPAARPESIKAEPLQNAKSANKSRRDIVTADVFGSPAAKIWSKTPNSPALPSKCITKVVNEAAAEEETLSHLLISAENRQLSGKLDITAANESSDKEEFITSFSEQSKPTTPNMSSRPRASAASVVSQLSTPAMTTSLTAASSATCSSQARTLRVLAAPKLETSSRFLPTDLVTANLANANAKQPIVRPSQASVDRPSTPVNDFTSDNASFTSTSISHPSSPPPGRVGTAPVRPSTKSQQKKGRQARAKIVEEAKKSEEVPEKVAPDVPIQAPIIGRKKKSKKSKVAISADSTSVGSGPSSPRPKEEVAQEPVESETRTLEVEDRRTAKEARKESKKEAAKARAEAKLSDAAADQALVDIGEKLQKALVSASSIFADLQAAGEINFNAIDLFRNVPGINHRFDVSDSDLSETNSLPILSGAQIDLLEQDEAVCVELGNDRRVIVLPDRRTLRGFTHDQAQRYLELRKKNLAATGPTVFNSPRHSINRWLHAPPTPIADPDGNPIEPPQFFPRSGAGVQDFTQDFQDRFTSSSPTMTRGGTYGQGQRASNYWSELAAAGVGTGTGAGMGPVEGMHMRVPKMGVEEAEEALLKARKETEGIEKRLNTLAKKNRRLLVGNAH